MAATIKKYANVNFCTNCDESWSGSKTIEAQAHAVTTGHTVEEWEMSPARVFSPKDGGVQIRRYDKYR